jgi:arylsulfatase
VTDRSGKASGAGSSASRTGAARRPNVLLVLVDDLGYSDVGCYGGEIETPTLDGLAAEGAQFRDFYVQPRCSPTRASLMTGQTNQLLGFDVLTGDGELRRNHVFLPELLRADGYRTYLSGKWHLGGTANFGPSDVDRDPRVRGFDHVYRFSGYAESPWDPDTRLLSNTPDTYRLLSDAVEERSYRHDPDSTRYEPGETFYQTDAITDYALDFLEHDRRQNERGERRPFFLYLAYGAPHFPLAAPRSLTEKYVSRYEAGWDAIREDRLQRMIDRGVVPSDVVLPPRGDVPARESGDWETHRVRAWESLSSERRTDLVRRMAVFAAMVEMIDRNLDRVLEALEEQDELEDTLVLFMSDNGACYEWHEFGHSADDGPRTGAALSRMGTAAADRGLKYGAGWANVGSTPYRLYKHFGHEGGIRSPLIVRWGGLDDSLRDGLVDDVACSRDLVPTILDLLDVERPDAWTARDGQSYEVAAFDETCESLCDLLVDGESLGDREIAWEHEGNAAYRSARWKLVGKNFDGTDGVPAYAWELYDLGDDPTETTNLAADQPERVRELAGRWLDWAERNDVSVPEEITVPS